VLVTKNKVVGEGGHLNEAIEPKAQGKFPQERNFKLAKFTFTKATIYLSNVTSN